MADNSNSEIVELIIEAKNLAHDELNQTADELSQLGSASRKAAEDLKKLKIQQDTINSYRAVESSVKQLRDELDRAELDYEKMAKAIKKNTDATDEELLAVRTAKRELRDMRNALRDQEGEYRKLSKSIKTFSLSTDDLGSSQTELDNRIKETSDTVARLNAEYIKQGKALKVKIDAEREAIRVSKEQEQAAAEQAAQMDKLAREQEQAAAAAKAAADAERLRTQEQQRTAAALAQYEAALRRLHLAQEEGRVSSANAIRAEEKLRQALELTEGQTKTLRQALNAERDDRKKAARAIQEQADELEKLVAEEKKAQQTAVAAAAAERQAAQETARVATAVKQYEAELSKLNAEKSQGKVSTADYIRGEARLRRELKLTETQVKTSRRAIEADAKTKSDAVRNTDLLTQATRRLAQVYTVLLASQKAVEAVGAGVREYGELESAITKVEKTTGLARKQTEDLAKQLTELATEITPTAKTELLRYAEVAGQLGTKSTADLMQLVSAADALELSTNLAGDEAVELLARILTMTGEGIPAIHNLSSSVVALGNDFAASEQDIVHMTKEIVTGTREINLSSQAAAAFGVTLAELGQPAERSRTAIQRLAGAIKEGAIKGGEDLERLANITKLTGEEIVEALGKEPEKVMVEFLKGLQAINDAGGQMSSVLKRMGIDGTEALSVLSILAGGVNRLETALALSNKEFEAGDAHMKEAIKSYANQESAIGRLSNKFGVLKAKIGEAFSDETDRAVREFGDIIEDIQSQVVEIMEVLPELVEGALEAVGALDDLVSTFTGTEGLDNVTTTLNLIKASFNGITVTLNILIQGIQELAYNAALLYNAFQPLEDLQISTEFLDNLKKNMADTKAKIEQDVDDINLAYARMSGESSQAYEDLRTAAVDYRDALSKLTAEQQTAISEILLKNEYSKEENGLYRELTAAVIRANREMEIEAKLKDQLKKNNRTNEIKADAVALDAANAAQQRLTVSMADYDAQVGLVRAAQANINSLLEDGMISQENAAQANELLNQSLERYTVTADKTTTTTLNQRDAAQQYITAQKALDDALKLGAITQGEYDAGMKDLSVSYGETASASSEFTRNVEGSSKALADINDKIAQTTKAITEYENELKAGNLTEQESVRVTAALAKEKEKLKLLSAEQQQLAELENATYSELVIKQREYQTELRLLEAAFKSGRLTKAEYEQQVRRLVQALRELQDLIENQTEVQEENNDSTERTVQLNDERSESTAKVASYMSLELAVAQQLNKEYDYSNTRIERLNERYRQLQEMIVENSYVSTGFFENLAKVSNQVFEQEKAAISATIAMRKMMQQIDAGNLSLAQLDKMAYRADNSLRGLSQNQLEPLRRAIRQAKQDIQDLNETIDDALYDVEDRLDRALGKEQDIAKRKFARELEEYTDLLDKAQQAGDSALVNKINEVIRKLQQAQKLEYESEFGTSGTRATSPAGTTPSTGASQTRPAAAPTPTTPGQQTKEATLHLVVGGSPYSFNTDSDTLDKLMSDVERQQRLSGG